MFGHKYKVYKDVLLSGQADIIYDYILKKGFLPCTLDPVMIDVTEILLRRTKMKKYQWLDTFIYWNKKSAEPLVDNQIVLTLLIGKSRKIIVGKKSFTMKSGSCLITHGKPVIIQSDDTNKYKETLIISNIYSKI